MVLKKSKIEKTPKTKKPDAAKVADTSVPPVDAKNPIIPIGDKHYENVDGDLYEWNWDANGGEGARGDRVGRLTGTCDEDYGINTDA